MPNDSRIDGVVGSADRGSRARERVTRRRRAMRLGAALLAAMLGAVTAAAAPPAVPVPQAGDVAAETAHIARYDAAIAAVRDIAVSPDDAKNLKDAITRIAANDAAGARGLQQQIGDPLARKIVDWYRLRAGLADAAEYRAFLAANPTWPSAETLTRRFEEALFTTGGNSRTIRDQFDGGQPRTGAGYAALASAALADGDEATAVRLARTAWRDYTISAALEPGFIERFGRFLVAADHKWRLDRLLMDDPRWSPDRNERGAIVRRMLPLLDAGARAKAEARLAVFLRGANAAKLMAALPSEETPDWGMSFQHVQYLRRAHLIDEAIKVLLAVPLESPDITSPDAWWAERRGLAFDALRTGNPQLAYRVVASSAQLSINPLKDQLFHAGWIALSHLHDAKLAQSHFEALAKVADGPLSRAKSGYWLGRALEALGRKVDAKAQYGAASRYVDTFHGQLSRRKVESASAVLKIVYPAAPKPAEIERFAGLDAARAAVIAHKANLDVSISRLFLLQLARLAPSEAETGMLAQMAEAFGDTQTAVRIAKAGIARGFEMVPFAYPLHAFPAFTPLTGPPEEALLLSIARQESEFDTTTRSGAGAKGLLQVMTVTANHVCGQYKIKCEIQRLMTDTSYNTMLAAAYIGDRMHELGDSYVLGIAGYNAGPGRARQWIREFGDPRDPQVDAIDWIHRIPFEETREYVQKVLSNLQVYRARMAAQPPRLMIEDDLERGRSTAVGRAN